jgi:hypothetical protein
MSGEMERIGKIETRFRITIYGSAFISAVVFVKWLYDNGIIWQ